MMVIHTYLTFVLLLNIEVQLLQFRFLYSTFLLKHTDDFQGISSIE